MHFDGSISGWAFRLLFAILTVRYFQGIVTFGTIQDKHLRDPNKRPFWTQSANSPYWSEEGKRWQKEQQRFGIRTVVLLVSLFLVLDFFT
jgi:hypothetical protein